MWFSKCHQIEANYMSFWGIFLHELEYEIITSKSPPIGLDQALKFRIAWKMRNFSTNFQRLI